MSVSLKKLLEDPFGPYPDQYILNPTWARRGSFRPTLTSVQMRCAGEDIGLDETELLDEAPPTSRFVKNDVEVTGALEIERLDWLSDQGKTWLSHDLRKRDDEKSTSTRASRLTLEEVYGMGLIAVRRFRLDDDPESLVLFAENEKRSFRLASLDVKTFSLSRNFIERYTIRRMMQQLILGCDTPITERDIEWLVQQYFKQVIPLDKDIRYIYNPNIAGIVTNSRGALKLSTPRHSRPVHKAEIRKIFAKHAEWILADHIVVRQSPNARYLDIPQWHKFVQQVKFVFDPPAPGRRVDIATSLTKFGGKREDWQRRLDNAIRSPLHWQQRRELEKAPQRATPKIIPSVQPSSHQQNPAKPPIRARVVPDIEFQYDSDFSEASTPPASDSESEAADQRLVEKVPWYCRVPPELEESQHVWRCPGCKTYHIDLLHPAEEELEEIPEYYAEILRSKDWQKVTDARLLTAFGHLVSNHYEEHLKKLGIQLVTEDGEVSVRKWPEERARRKSRRLNRI
ncbi:hypothetical protein D9756_001489 [Leucocoprinus leucothites]|uniref:Uncharacterized protein n=1 Tax=Leucocoprinus leucothites TaxID=201217 RepID=A0A8H5G586_9AGAR|nr:hypothetical protein D9756_001489 [Leucoagaricus leucothites]